ncbi:spore coat protein [Chungangia koreensis]|uniref:Spore coat protein n=1 Tax=Chungangia koreensis TaxID=752657 RepID=A0ABV8X6J9_9LACT
MESSTIKNPTAQVPDTPEMNDRDLITDALSTEKHLANSYVTALHEASHDAFYQSILGIFEDTSKQQRNFYDLMFQHGWYSITPAQSAEIKQAEQQFTTSKQQLQ